jgi:uncharacterized membrane protein YcaP (DUF421 family)
MSDWFKPEWSTMLVPSVPIAETILRGTLVYLALFFFLRFVLKRQAGNVSLSDMLLIVLVADASQNAMANEYKSVTDGLILVATLLFWDYVLDWLSYRWSPLRSMVYPEPLLLIRDGEIMKQNLKQELLTEDQLRSYLRQQEVEDVQDVREAYMEGDGQISVLKKEKAKVNNENGRADLQRFHEALQALRGEITSLKEALARR